MSIVTIITDFRYSLVYVVTKQYDIFASLLMNIYELLASHSLKSVRYIQNGCFYY